MNSQQIEDTDADRLRGILDVNALSVDLVSALAEDRPLTKAEENRLAALQRSRGHRYFCDILYALTHQYFPPETAEDLWKEILRHKMKLSAVLRRNVRVVVATLDYLSNITENMNSVTLVGEEVIEEIVGLSLRDGLTCLYNHTYFFQQIDWEVMRYVRYGTPVSLMLIDIDNFKEVNDTYGHQEGDRILASMGRSILLAARDSDICCRYGGEEFAVILPLTDVEEASVVAKRVQAEMTERLPDGRTVTVSVGVASCGQMIQTYQCLVKKVDVALYRAKRDGKNQVAVAVKDD